MSDHEPAIIIRDLHKSFKLPHEQHSGIKQRIINIFKGVKGYETLKVLNNISFEIKKGEFFGIVGRNGSGKSTLLKLIAGIYAPDKGLIQVNGSLTPFIELGVGFNPELTGRENVFLNGSLLGFSHKETSLMYESIVDFAELENFMDQKLKNYSSGMQVRLAFSIAIKANTDILLFDEVLAVGDENFQKKCLGIFRELKKAGKTIILVSHSTGDVEKFCDRVLVLDKSKKLGVFKARKAVSLYQELNFEPSKLTNFAEVGEKGKRWGTKDISIDNVKVGENNRAWTDKKLEINISLKSKKISDRAVPIRIGLAFYDEQGINIGGPNSGDENLEFPPNANKFDVSFSLSNNILNRGSYNLTVGVFSADETVTYDYWIDSRLFEVASEEEHFGKVVLDGQWK